MTGDALVRGKHYTPVGASGLYPGREVVYVGRETLKDGVWETFFSAYEGMEIVGGESGIMDYTNQRVRARPDDISAGGDIVIFRDSVAKLVNKGAHTKIVQRWLEKVDQIERERCSGSLAK